MSKRSRKTGSSNGTNTGGNNTGVGKHRPANGREFDVEEIKAKESYETAQTRNRLALLFSATALTVLLGIGVHGLFTGKFIYLLSIWAVVGPVLGGISSYYFGRGRKDSG